MDRVSRILYTLQVVVLLFSITFFDASSFKNVKGTVCADVIKQKQSEKDIHVNPKMIRVLIDEKSTNDIVKFTVRADNGFVLESPGGSKVTALFNEKCVDIIARKGRLYLRCSDNKFRHIRYDDLEVYSSQGDLNLNDKKYQGSVNIRIVPSSGNVLIINRIDLEDYVYSVLRSEIVPTWPLEIQKVQAIASRSYALHHMKYSRLKNPYNFYDIKNTNLNQVYNGVHKYKRLRDAVDQTRGLILTYKGDIALTMFDMCCGGIIPAKMRKNRKYLPYLRRDIQCFFCKDSKIYRNYLICKKNDFLNELKLNPSLKKRLEGFGDKLNDIQIVDKDVAGVVYKIKMAGRKYVTLTGQELVNSLKGKIKSLAFDIKKEEDKLTFIVKGWGHFNGLCQWGARELVRQGWNYKRILNFYYPGTDLSKLH